MAVRLFAAEPTECMCIECRVPMEQGDHSNCSIELLSCPEHRDAQMRAMGYDPRYVLPSRPESEEQSAMFKDADGNPIAGFCLWCNRDFYPIEEHNEHFADGATACPVFRLLKDENCMPPVLQKMFEDAGFFDDEAMK